MYCFSTSSVTSVALMFAFSIVFIQNCHGFSVLSRDDENSLTDNLNMDNINTDPAYPENESEENETNLLEDNYDFGDIKSFDLSDISQEYDFNKRGSPVFTADNGYGSRLAAGSRLVQNQLAWHNIFGRGGPGKRSFSGRRVWSTQGAARENKHGSMSVFRDRNNNRNSKDNYRIMDNNALEIDNGLGLRINGLHRADNDWIDTHASTKRRLVDQGGLGLRVRESNGVYDDYNGEIDNVRSPQKRVLVNDSGYGSRIDAANKLAVDLSAMDYVFGRYGPGKR